VTAVLLLLAFQGPAAPSAEVLWRRLLEAWSPGRALVAEGWVETRQGPGPGRLLGRARLHLAAASPHAGRARLHGWTSRVDPGSGEGERIEQDLRWYGDGRSSWRVDECRCIRTPLGGAPGALATLFAGVDPVLQWCTGEVPAWDRVEALEAPEGLPLLRGLRVHREDRYTDYWIAGGRLLACTTGRSGPYADFLPRQHYLFLRADPAAPPEGIGAAFPPAHTVPEGSPPPVLERARARHREENPEAGEECR